MATTTKTKVPKPVNVTPEQIKEAKQRLIDRVSERLPDMFHSAGTLRVAYLFSKDGVAILRSNWFGSSGILLSRYLHVYEENGQVVIKDATAN